MTISEIKQEASTKLRANFSKMILNYAVFYIALILLEAIPLFIKSDTLKFLYQLVLLAISTPFSYGIIVSLKKISEGENVSITYFISFALNNLVKIWGIFVRIFQKLIVLIILFIISWVLLFTSTRFSITSPTSNNGFLMSISSIFIIITTIILFIKSFKYALVAYVFLDEPNLTCKEIVEKSAELMNGNSWNFVKLALSFIGWAILISFIASAVESFSYIIIGKFLLVIQIAVTIYVSVYFYLSLIGFYEDLKLNMIGNKSNPENTVQ